MSDALAASDGGRVRWIWLLVAVVVTVVVVAPVAFFIGHHGSGSGGSTSVPIEQQPGYQDAHEQAQIYCTLGGVVPGMKSIYDPAYLNCVDEQTKINMAKGAK